MDQFRMNDLRMKDQYMMNDGSNLINSMMEDQRDLRMNYKWTTFSVYYLKLEVNDEREHVWSIVVSK